MSLFRTVSEIQRDIGRKSPIVAYITSIWRPFGVMPLEFRRDFWPQKTRVLGLSYGGICVILGLVI